MNNNPPLEKETPPNDDIFRDTLSTLDRKFDQTKYNNNIPKQPHHTLETDNVVIYNENNNTKVNEPQVVENKLTNNEQENEDKCLQSKKSKIILFTILGLFFTIAIVLVVVWLTVGFGKKKEQSLQNKNLIVNLKRELNEISRFIETKHSITSIGIGDIIYEEKERFTSDFALNIRNITQMPDKTNLYDAYLVLISMSKLNETNATAEEEEIEGIDIYNIQSISEYLSSLSEEEVQEFYNETNALPLLRLSFYENGTVNDMEYPTDISGVTLEEMKRLVEKVVPSISKDLYTETKELPNIRNLQAIDGDKANYYMSTKDKSTLYNVEQHEIKDDNVKFHNSKVNSLTETQVDNNEGVITNVNSEGDVTFVQSESKNEDYGEPKINQNSPLAGSTNGMNDNIIKSDFKSVGGSITSSITFKEKIINKNITKFLDELASYITFTQDDDDNEGEEGENITKQLLKSLNIPNAKIISRNISDIPVVSSQEELTRKLKVENFLKPIEFSYPIFKYDHVGLRISLNSLILIDTNNGKVTLTSVMTIGSTTVELMKREHDTQLGNILDSADNSLELTIKNIENFINKINNQNSQWKDNISNLADLITNKINNTYHVGALYRIPMKEVYTTIQEFTKNVFEQMSSLIENTSIQFDNKINYTNTFHYTLVQELNELITAFINECKNFFETVPNEILNDFYAKSVNYSNSISSSINAMSDFNVNIYFNILTQLEKGKEMFASFTNEILESFDIALENFSQLMQSQSNSLLYNTLTSLDFIGTAIENNIIISEVISENSREHIANLSYSFRQQVTMYVDAIFTKLKQAYNVTICGNEIDSAKNKLKTTVTSMLNEYNIEMDNIINNIKSKIPHIDNFEFYIKHNPDVLDMIETELLKIEEEQYNSLIAVPLFTLHREYYKQSVIIDINNSLNSKVNAIIQQINNDIKRASFNLPTVEFFDTQNIEQKYSDDLNRITQNIIKALNSESSLLHYDNFNYFLEKAEDELKNIIQQNYNYGRQYVNEIYDEYSFFEKMDVVNEIYRTSLYDERYILTPTKSDELINSIQSNLKMFLKSTYLNLSSNLQSYIQQHLIPQDIDLSKYKDMDFVIECINKIFNFVESKMNAELFTEQNFENDYATQITNIISNISHINNEYKDVYLNYDGILNETLQMCNDSECDGDLFFILSNGKSVHNSKTADNLKKVVHEVDNLYFNEHIIQVIFDTFAENELQTQLNEFKNKVVNLYNSIKYLENDFTNLTPFKNLVNDYEKESLKIINNYLGETLLHNLYSRITNNIDSKISTYFTQIANKLSLLNNDYISNHLKQSVGNFMDHDEPSEIILKLNNLVSIEQNKARQILDDIENMFNSEFELIIQNCYNIINNTLNSTINTLVSNIPKFPFQEFEKPRREYINEKINSIIDKVISSKEVFANITIKSFLLGVDEDDFYDIRNQNIALYKQIVGDPIRSYANKASIEIELNGKYSTEDFNKNDFQAVKLRSSIKYFDDIYYFTSERILNSERGNWEIFSANDLLSKYNNIPTYNYKVNDIVYEMNNALLKLNNVTKEKLVPYFDITKQNLRSVFEEMASDQVFKKQLNEYSNKIYSLSNLFESEINFLYLTFETKIFEIFKEELDFIFENDEIKINDRPYYVDQTQLNQTFELYKQSLITNFENIIQMITHIEINDKIISKTKEEYYQRFNIAVDSFKNEVNNLSFEKESYELLNITYNFMELTNRALNNTYLDILKEKFAENAKEILTNNFTTIINILKEKALYLEKRTCDYLQNKYDRFLNRLLEESTEPVNETVLEINTFSQDFRVRITNQINSLDLSTIALFEENSIHEMIINNIFTYSNIFELKLNEEYIKTQIEEIDYIFREVCIDRYLIETSEFKEQYLYPLLNAKFTEAIETLFAIDGDIFGQRIYNKIIDVDGMRACRIAGQKLDFIYVYLGYVLETLNGEKIDSSTKQIFDELLPNLNDTLQNDLIEQSDYAIKEFLNVIKNELSKKFTNIFKETVLSSDLIKNSFSSKVITVIKRAFSLGYTEMFENNFISFTEENWVNVWKGKISKGIKNLIDNCIIPEIQTKNEQYAILLAPIEIELIDSSYILILNEINKFDIAITNCLDGIQSINFVFSDSVMELFNTVLTNEMLNPLNDIKNTYDILQEQLLIKVEETLDQFDNYALQVAEIYKTDEMVEFINGIYIDILTEINTIKEYIINGSKDTLNLRRIKSVLNGIGNHNSLGEIPTRNLREEGVDIDVQQLSNSIEDLKLFLEELRETISNYPSVVRLITTFHNFQSILSNGLIQIKIPINSLIEKLETYFTTSKLENFKTLIDEQITTIKEVVDYHYTQVSTITEKSINALTIDLYEVFNDIKAQTENNYEKSFEKSLKVIKQDFDPLHILESFDAVLNKHVRVTVKIINIPFTFTFSFNCQYVYNIFLGMSDLNVVMDAFLGTQMTFSPSAGISYKGSDKYTATIDGNVQMSEIRIKPTFDLRKFAVQLDASINLKPTTIKLYVKREYDYWKTVKRGWWRKKRKKFRGTQTKVNKTIKSNAIRENIPMEY